MFIISGDSVWYTLQEQSIFKTRFEENRETLVPYIHTMKNTEHRMNEDK